MPLHQRQNQWCRAKYQCHTNQVEQRHNVIFFNQIAADHDDFGLTARNTAEQSQGKIIFADADQKKQSSQSGEDRRRHHGDNGCCPAVHMGENIRPEIAANQGAKTQNNWDMEPARHTKRCADRCHRAADKPDAKQAAKKKWRRQTQILTDQASRNGYGKCDEHRFDVGIYRVWSGRFHHALYPNQDCRVAGLQ